MTTAVVYHRGSAPASVRPKGPRRRERLSAVEILILVTALVAVITAALLPSLRYAARVPASTRTVAVRASESLWDLARTYPVEDNSTAQNVDVIRRLNHLEQSALKPGQLLRVPAQAVVFAADARP